MKQLKKIYGDIDLAKSQKQEDGTLIVCGYASSGSIDSDGETITSEAMKSAIPDYMKFGAVREMHGSNAAGTALTIQVQEDGRTYFECLVVDPVAVKKCELGVYKAFSIGGKVKERDSMNKSIIKAINLIEVSLVDRPANPEAVFECFKAETLEEKELDLQEQATDPLIVEKSADEVQSLEVEIETIEEVIVEEVAKNEPLLEVSTETQTEPEIAKNLYSVARLAEILEDLKGLAEWIEFEDGLEEEKNSAIPDELKTIVLNLSNILNAKVQEEINEIVDELTEQTNLTTANKSIILNEEDIIKAGSRNSKTDLEKIQKIHDLVLELGAVSPSNVKTVKAEEIDDLAKTEDIKKSLNDSIEKAAQLEKEKDELVKRVKELEDLPQPRKASITSISKSQDFNEREEVKVAPVMKSDGSIDETATLMKQALSSKQVIGLR